MLHTLLEKKILGQLRLGESLTSCPALNYTKQTKMASPIKAYITMLFNILIFYGNSYNIR